MEKPRYGIFQLGYEMEYDRVHLLHWSGHKAAAPVFEQSTTAQYGA